MRESSPFDSSTGIAVIGAGFSGSLAAIHLLETCPHGIPVTLIERSGRFGRGLAYGTENPSHLLNVMAGRMSAFPDKPDHFLAWLRSHPAEGCAPFPGPVEAGSFVPRRVYGRYIQALLAEAETRAPGRLRRMAGIVVDIEPAAEGAVLHLSDSAPVAARTVVLATGNPAPRPLPGLARLGPAYRNDPWAEDALDGLAPDAPVLLLGTGLTMVDMLLTLLDRGHRGRVLALSRRGLAPAVHAPAARRPDACPVLLPASTAGTVQTVRRAIEAAGDWRCVMDGLRQRTQDLWRGLDLDRQDRLLRHLRPWWDVHRHRLAPEVGARLEKARDEGQVEVRAGRLVSSDPHPAGAVIGFRPRGGGPVESSVFARILNCTGPAGDWSHVDDPLPQALLARGLATPDPLGLSVRVAPDGALVGADGVPSRTLFAVGPPTRSLHWETTAVPDIRRQVQDLAEMLGRRLPVGAAA